MHRKPLTMGDFAEKSRDSSTALGMTEKDDMSFKDHFSKQAAEYAKFRPGYSQELFNYLATLAPSRQLAWDCGTGNGQAAIELSSVFDRVIATDASEKQIANAQPHERVEYRVAPAENSGLNSGTVDLIMVAQALHWFDLDRFYAEARRVLKPKGVLAASAYNLLQIEPAIDAIVNRYYYEVVGSFWPPERKLVERFADLPFSFHEIDPPKFEMTAQWDLDHLLGYLRTWSSTQRFIAAKGNDPLEQIIDDLRRAWGDSRQTRRVVWPLTLRIGHKPRSGGLPGAP
ncbi:MAG TPA: class I SAM-dependent methyltransferase [Candidatus Udaeobacter sp.]|nr:class I SAM-dependent methyltransferase [Candidatus Udaeobacter sp.]